MNAPWHASDGSQSRGSITSRSWRRWTLRLLKIGFFLVVAYLLVSQARLIEWDRVMAAIRQRHAQELLTASVFAAASYLLYCCFDLLGRYATGHTLSVRQVISITFISYAFNLNLGALIGGVAFRYRLYSRFGLGNEVITHVAGMSMLTNWLGYLLLGGLVFWWQPPSPPQGWKLDAGGMRELGIAMFAAAVGYLLLCTFARQRTWTIRGHDLTLPSLRLAVLQLAISCLNWLLIASVVYTLLQQKIAFPTVVGVLLVGAIAGVITHVPAGLGVLEAVFVALLSSQMPRHELLAALVIYRFIYYLFPLMVAVFLYLFLEARAKKNALSELPRT